MLGGRQHEWGGERQQHPAAAGSGRDAPVLGVPAATLWPLVLTLGPDVCAAVHKPGPWSHDFPQYPHPEAGAGLIIWSSYSMAVAETAGSGGGGGWN